MFDFDDLFSIIAKILIIVCGLCVATLGVCAVIWCVKHLAM